MSTVVLAVAPPLLLDCLRVAVTSSGFDVLAATSHGREAIRAAITLRPSVVVLTLRLPPYGGAHVLTSILHARSELRVVTLADAESRAQADETLRIGAVSAVCTDIDWSRFAGILRSAATGDTDLGPVRRSEPTPTPVLSRRQSQVLQLVYHGCSVPRIAEELGISAKTVKHHLSAVYSALGVHSRTDAVLVALRRGLLGNPQLSGCSEPSADGASPFSP